MPKVKFIPVSQRKAGAEVEYTRANKSKPFAEFRKKLRIKNKYDGSCGWEAVTPPLAGKRLESTLSRLAKAMNTYGASQNSSCGTHVHVDVSDYDFAAARRLCVLYVKIEPLLYLIAGQHRANNGYCRPNGQILAEAVAEFPEDPEAAVLAGVYYEYLVQAKGSNPWGDKWYHPKNGDLEYGVTNVPHMVKYEAQAPSKKHSCRYVGMNLCPMFSARAHGRKDCTVEFRMHRETKDPERLVGWTKLLVQIVSYARKCTDNDIKSILDMKSAAKILSDIVAPDSAGFISKRIKDYRRAVPNAHRRIKFNPKTGFTMNQSPQTIGARIVGSRRAVWIAEAA